MNIIERPATQLAEGWMILVFLFALVVLAWLRWRYPGSFAQAFRSFTNTRIMRQMMREETLFSRQNLLMSILFYTSAGMLSYLALKFSGMVWPGIHGIVLFLVLLLFVILIYAVKSLFISLVQVITDGDFSLAEYRYNVFLVNRIAAIALLPLTLIVAYTQLQNAETMLWICAGIACMFWLYRILRGIAGAYSQSVPLFYILFYICAFEILPLALCWRIAIR